MQKAVAIIVCLSLIASSQAFILGNDNLSGLFLLNMMQGRPGLDLGGLLGGRSAAGVPSGQAGGANTAQMVRQRSPFGNLMNLALLSESGMF